MTTGDISIDSFWGWSGDVAVSHGRSGEIVIFEGHVLVSVVIVVVTTKGAGGRDAFEEGFRGHTCGLEWVAATRSVACCAVGSGGEEGEIDRLAISIGAVKFADCFSSRSNGGVAYERDACRTSGAIVADGRGNREWGELTEEG